MEQLSHILFIDIETVSVVPGYSMLSEGMQAQWDRKARYLKSTEVETPDSAQLFSEKAGIFSEFAKVVCISIGSFVRQQDKWTFRLKSIVNENEKFLLQDFHDLVARFSAYHSDLRFCGHNIKEFDIPFLCRRMMINGVHLPDVMQLSGKKPWEINHIDTLELWRFGDYKHFTSLALLAEVFGLPSPKDDMDGSMVGQVYWETHDLDRIAKYCMQDVLTTAKVFLKLKGLGDMMPEPVYVTEKE